MKTVLKTILSFLFILCLFVSTEGQRSHPHDHDGSDTFCKAMEVLGFQSQQDPAFQAKMEEIERFTQKVLRQSSSRSSMKV